MSPQSTVHSPQSTLVEKQREVERILASFSRVIVAFSGGVDSTLLAQLAVEVLGREQVLAVTADSPSLARQDLAETIQLAGRLGLRHQIIKTKEVENPSYQANSQTRCYFCKRELFQELEELAKAEGISTILYGAIGDDLFEERPGQQAAREQGIRAPLQEIGLTKEEIRRLAQRLGLPNWDQPQNACLSSRIPHGTAVTVERLALVERAEALIRAEGFRQVRVRYQGAHASIEVGSEELLRLRNPDLSRRVLAAVRDCGFETAEIDLHGYHRRNF